MGSVTRLSKSWTNFGYSDRTIVIHPCDRICLNDSLVALRSTRWSIFTNPLFRVSLPFQIDEPDTPFEYYDHNGDDDASGIERNATGEDQQPNPTNLISLDQSALERKLGAVAAVRECFPSEEGGRDEAQRQITREREFSMSRKHHYNEMEMLKKFRAANPEGLLDDEDEDEDANDMEV